MAIIQLSTALILPSVPEPDEGRGIKPLPGAGVWGWVGLVNAAASGDNDRQTSDSV